MVEVVKVKPDAYEELMIQINKLGFIQGNNVLYAKLCKYASTNGWSIHMYIYEEELGCPAEYCTITVNKEILADRYVYIDSKKLDCATKFITSNDMGSIQGIFKNTVTGGESILLKLNRKTLKRMKKSTKLIKELEKMYN